MKFQNFLLTSIKKISNKIKFICFLILSSIILSQSINLTIDYDGNYYNANNWIEEESKIYFDSTGTTTHLFENLFPANYDEWDDPWDNNIYLNFEVSGDFNSQNEYASFYIESNLIGTIANFYDQYSCFFYDQYQIPYSEFNNDYIDDNTLEITLNNSPSVDLGGCSNGDDYHQVNLYYDSDPQINFGEVEIGSTIDLNLIVDNFYDEYNTSPNLVFIDIEGDSEFYCTNLEDCGSHVINNSSHTANIAFTPSNLNFYQSSLVVYDYNDGDLHEIKLTGTGTEAQNLGDVNNDDIVNINDIIIIINYIFSQDYNVLGDMNSDGILNVADIIILVNVILDN